MENLIDFLQDLRGHINNDESLSYIENVSVAIFRGKNYPDFDKYGVILSPESMQFELVANQLEQEANEVDVVCLVENFNKEKALLGTGQEKGIISMVYDVRKSLLAFISYIHKTKPYIDVDCEELSSTIQLNQHKLPDTKDFFYEVTIPLKINFKAIKREV